ncbi:MAG: bifunctional UDP-N-acetylmuramoyl-tripeptide:D-alanyl-D-alanine ligase/alanine racemase [Prevotella sp.]|nr:bifunctional UDP-N-acetylmuramoyl-tripeptide:D-alanyl-D-alanine ligase/alanine racemase [Prevotella sp.]
MTYTIRQIKDIIGAAATHVSDAPIRFLLTDSRSLCFPEQTLFFAIKTGKGDGAAYIPELIERGVRSFVVSSLPAGAENEDICFLVVSDVKKALQRLATHHRQRFDVPVVGITGSNGKTIVKEWLYQLLSPERTITRSPRSYNSQIGVPLSVWLMDKTTQTAIIEAGISEPGEMNTLEEIIRPTVGVFTFLGAAHQEHFPSLQQKCIEKMTLFRDTETVITGGDDLVVRRSLAASHLKGRLLIWSRTDEASTLFIIETVKADGRSRIRYRYAGQEADYEIPFADNASIANSITCALTALYFGLTPDDLRRRMPLLEAVEMRLNVVEGKRGLTIINDFYNSDINSLTIALDFMHRRGDRRGRRKTVVLSDLLQTGMERERLYEQVNDLLTANGIDRFIGIGDGLCDTSDKFTTGEKYFFHTVEAFVGSDVFHKLSDELLLLKGARRFGFERIEELLVDKVHETKLEVNLSAIAANLDFFRSHLHPGVKLTCMIKAEAYGAGAVEIAKTLQENRVDYLAVAVADEGVELRRNGITGNIIVMNPEMTSFKTLFDYDLEPEVYSFRLLDALAESARREGIQGFPCHIKLDTGMCRLGFDPEKDIDELIRRLQKRGEIIPRSVFSHFAGADDTALNDFTQTQFTLFDKASRRIQKAFNHKIIRHICNSAGILAYPEYQLDMCRLGIGLYGINPLDNATINNVSTLKTVILQIRNVKKGASIGYGRHTFLSRDSRIADIPIGYADGLDRRLGNRRAYCLVGSQKAEYVGNICMDVCMIDVTDINCKEGDEVVIFGKDLPVTVLSRTLGTIPYEILAGISPRVKRVYFKE